jgi:hypothetical protein
MRDDVVAMDTKNIALADTPSARIVYCHLIDITKLISMRKIRFRPNHRVVAGTVALW